MIKCVVFFMCAMISLQSLPATQQQPVLILVGGFQGSGKTTLIEKIQEVYDVQVVSTDEIRQKIIEKGGYTHEQFVQYVKDDSEAVIKEKLKDRVHLIIDANAHEKRISEINRILEKTGAQYTVLKIYLDASEKTLRQRIENRSSVTGQYQGTVNDLIGSLSSTKFNRADYDLVIDTGRYDKEEVFQQTKAFLSPHFSLQSTSLYPFIRKNGLFLSLMEDGFQRLDVAKTTEQRRELEHAIVSAIDAEKLEPKRRFFQLGIDRSPEHLPYPENEFKLQNGESVSASICDFSDLAPECPKMIAAQGPMPETITRFWSMVDESNSHLVIMLTGLVDEALGKMKCTRYWPENVGETLSLGDKRYVTLESVEKIATDGEKELWRSSLRLNMDGKERLVTHDWLKGWKDGAALDSLELQNKLLAEMRAQITQNPTSTPIVHCSAGIGRTGTILGSYLFKYHLKKLEKTDTLPFELTLYLRSKRSHMIHTIDQYKGFCNFIERAQGS